MTLGRKFGQIFLLAGVLLLAGCDYLLSPEEKINAAMPVSTEARVIHDTLVSQIAPERLNELENAYQAKLRARALLCAGSYSPSRFSSIKDVRSKLVNATCFADKDRELTHWIRLRQAGMWLSKVPIAATPTQGVDRININGPIQDVSFASDAGVALLTSYNRSLTIVRLDNGEVVYQEDVSGNVRGSLSPNGQLFAFAQQGQAGDLTIRATSNGENLVRIPDAMITNFFWLDDTAAIYSQYNKPATLIDFSNGSETPVTGINEPILNCIRLPGHINRFALFTARSLTIAELIPATEHASIRIIHTSAPRRFLNNNYSAGFTADGAYSFYVAGSLFIASTDADASQEIPFPHFMISGAMASHDPDKILLYGRYQGVFNNAPRYLLYSVSQHSVDIGAAHITTGRPYYVAGLQRTAIAANSTLEIVDELPIRETLSIEVFKTQAETDLTLRQLEAQERNINPAPAQITTSPAPGQSTTIISASIPTISADYCAPPRLTALPAIPPIPGLPANSVVEAIGIYEASSDHRQKGSATVHINSPDRAVILVLTSYEAVNWNLEISPGTQLAALLIGGNQSTSVSGRWTGTRMARLTQYAYKCDSGLFRLDQEVHRLTGKQITHFQGKYTGNAFSIPAAASSSGAARSSSTGIKINLDCANAGTWAEQQICASPELQELDWKMDFFYKSALNRGEDMNKIQDEQQRWINQRNLCTDTDCLKARYRERIAALK